jgi:autotransporter-associated beta strand protein
MAASGIRWCSEDSFGSIKGLARMRRIWMLVASCRQAFCGRFRSALRSCLGVFPARRPISQARTGTQVTLACHPRWCLPGRPRTWAAVAAICLSSLFAADLAHPQQVPALSTANTGVAGLANGSYTLGWRFSVDRRTVVNSLGVRAAASGLRTAHDVGIWNAANRLLIGMATVPAGTASLRIGEYRYVRQRFTIQPGTCLIGATWFPNTDNLILSGSGIQTTLGVTYQGAVFIGGGILSPPIISNPTPGCFGPNFTIIPTQFWDGSNTTGNGTADGGTGTWAAATTNWTIEPAFTANAAWQSSIAVFRGSAGTVTVVGTQNVVGLQFDTTGYRLTGPGTINLVDDALVDAGADITATVDTILTGSTSLEKQGSGTVILNVANTYTGGTIMTGGTLGLGSNAALGTGAVTLREAMLRTEAVRTIANAITLGADWGMIDTNGVASTFSGVISGAGQLSVTGGGALTLTGANTYSGGTVVSGAGSVLAVDSSARLGAESGMLTLEDGGSLRTTAAATWSRDLVLAGGGTVDLSGWSGTWTGPISGTVGLTDSGPGTLTLTGTNSYTGGTLIVGNLTGVSVASDEALGDPSDNVTLNEGALIASAGFTTARGISLTGGFGQISVTGGPLVSPGTISGTAGLVKTGSCTLTISGTGTYTGATAMVQGTLALSGSGSIESSPSLDMTGANSVFDISALSASGTTVGSLLGSQASSRVVLGGKTLTTGTSGNSSFAGMIGGTGGGR